MVSRASGWQVLSLSLSFWLMLRNLRFAVDKIEARLMHVESHIACDSEGGEQLDPPGSNARVLANISSSDNK